MILRPATTDDRPGMAALHVASWRSAYRGLLPEDYLAGALAQDLAARWAEPDPAGAFQIVAEDSGQIAGFIAITDRDGPYVENLHVDQARRGHGLGERLLRAAAAELARRGEASLWLTLLDGNEGAIRFFARMGGEIGPRFDDDVFGLSVWSRAVRWPSLAALMDRPPAG